MVGSGSSSTRILNVSNFTAVETHHDIKAEIEYAVTQNVTITGYDNLLTILDVEVENGVLKLKYKPGYNISRNSNMVARIKMPVLTSTTIHGSQPIIASGFTNSMHLNTRIHGSGYIRVLNSSYQTAALDIYGSGNIEAQELSVKKTIANIYGSGNISTTTIDLIKTDIFGSGNVYYWGTPLLQTTQQGSGRVIKKG